MPAPGVSGAQQGQVEGVTGRWRHPQCAPVRGAWEQAEGRAAFHPQQGPSVSGVSCEEPELLPAPRRNGENPSGANGEPGCLPPAPGERTAPRAVPEVSYNRVKRDPVDPATPETSGFPSETSTRPRPRKLSGRTGTLADAHARRPGWENPLAHRPKRSVRNYQQHVTH